MLNQLIIDHCDVAIQRNGSVGRFPKPGENRSTERMQDAMRHFAVFMTQVMIVVNATHAASPDGTGSSVLRMYIASDAIRRGS